MAPAGRNLGYEDICRDLEHSHPHVDRGVVRLILSNLPSRRLEDSDPDPIPTSGRYVPTSIRRPGTYGRYWVVTSTHPSTEDPVRGVWGHEGWTVEDGTEPTGLYYHEVESY